jgi:hypothetical protein
VVLRFVYHLSMHWNRSCILRFRRKTVVRFIDFHDLVLLYFISFFCIGKTSSIVISLYFEYSVFRFSVFKINTVLVLSQLYTKGSQVKQGGRLLLITEQLVSSPVSFGGVAIVVFPFKSRSCIYYSNLQRSVICLCPGCKKRNCESIKLHIYLLVWRFKI